MFHFSALSAVVGLSLSIGALAAIGPVADLHIVNADIAPDGHTRPAVLAGGTFPGTLITGKKGDNFQLNVIDELTDETMLKSTSIHWHGFFQKGTNWADGPAFVTQCPITTNNSFLYNFDVPDQAGTFWYHSHLSTQYCDGLRGAFVVYDPYDPNADLYDVDDESTVITLADWYDTPVREIIGRAQFDATLINGLGRNAKGDLTAALAVITVERHKRYRFRLVSVSCDPNYKFSIENHPMTVIEVDGVNSQSLTVDSIQIFAGQRYSFILQANQPIGNYWIRANPNFGSTGFNNGINSAILRYVGAPEEEPAPSNFTSQTPLDETQLHPLYNPGVPGKPEIGGVDYAKNLLFSFSNGSFAIDNATFIPPNVPVLLQILSGAKSAQELMPKGSFIQLPPNSAIEISMPIPSTLVGVPHPFHLHGHNFHVVRSAGSTKYNFNDPVIRDVVNTGTPGDNVTIRFETNNPGPWFLHCHIDFHLEAGFALVFAEDIADTKAANPVPPAWDELCPKYDALGPGDL